VYLAAAQAEAQRIAKAIDDGVNLSGQAAATPANVLIHIGIYRVFFAPLAF
jgi:hypothetical protein